MSHGNPHVYEGPQVAEAETINEDFIAAEGINAETAFLSELTRNTEASLALAYEQHTANLIAYVSLTGIRGLNGIVESRLGIRKVNQ